MAAPNNDLFYMALRRPSSLQRPIHPESDEDALFLASGIEQTLDLLVDDEFNRGATWASFDNRQVLNIAADCIGRVCRLPKGHVHRKISIIGRGDWGGNLSEQRAGRRFSHALNRAIEGCVPIHRYQLMRGASLGWLRQVAAHDELFLSMAHANHVSVLVLGDVEWALEHNDLRHVRVGLVVETATPESDVDEVAIRLSRVGLFSARREILQAALSFMEQVRREHQWVLAELYESERERFEHPHANKAEIESVLCALQTRSWAQELREQFQNVAFSDRDSVTDWVLKLMTQTSIMDASSQTVAYSTASG